ncbi:MAG: molybdate ABC transporter substrate-binding protein [Methylotenera sp.]|nr:molybdate ABC transporter substrate-binding protein [Methylotenera sp.]
MQTIEEFLMQCKQALMGVLMMSLSSVAFAEEINIAAASDLKFAMDEIITQFKKANPVDDVHVIYGSSGKMFTQIQQDAPYDLYFSADISYPDKLAVAGFAVGPATPYAFGRIVLWSPKAQLDASKLSLEDLTRADITRIAIANPKHAPYGKRAVEALRSKNLMDKVEPKLVYGENIAQTAQFVQTGNAQVGIIALSLALSEALSKQGGYWLIPDTLHKPLKQGYIITKRAENNPLAKKFSAYISSAEARKIMVKYGFILPGDNKGKSQ